jgi:hypothetical protein
MEFHELLAVIEKLNAAIGHDAVDVAENELDLRTSRGKCHETASLASAATPTTCGYGFHR